MDDYTLNPLTFEFSKGDQTYIRDTGTMTEYKAKS